MCDFFIFESHIFFINKILSIILFYKTCYFCKTYANFKIINEIMIVIIFFYRIINFDVYDFQGFKRNNNLYTKFLMQINLFYSSKFNDEDWTKFTTFKERKFELKIFCLEFGRCKLVSSHLLIHTYNFSSNLPILYLNLATNFTT